MKYRIIQPFLLLLLLLCGKSQAEEFLYLEPFMDMRGFDGEVEVYTEDMEALFVSLESLKEVLKVELSIKNGRITGWFFYQNNPVEGDLNQGWVKIKDKQYTLGGRDIIEVEEQYFIATKVLEKWLDIKVQVEINRLLINFDTQGRHPYFESMKRKSRYGALDMLKTQEQAVSVIDNQYQWFSWPYSDLQINHTMGQNQQTSGVLGSVFDLSGHAIDLLASHNNGLTSYRMTARREGSWQDNHFHYEVGDVFFPAGKFLRGSFSGRGLAIHGNPLSRNYSRNFIVEGLPGWEVELYRDDQLIDYSQLDELGQYQFEGIDISAGQNSYKAVMYGPNGEIREQHFNFNVSNMGLYKGKWLPELYLIDPDVPTLGDTTRQSSFGRTAVGRLNYGLTNNINLGVGMINDFDDADKQTAFVEMLYISKTQVLDLGVGAPTISDDLSHSLDYSINTGIGTFQLSNYNAYLYEQTAFQKGSTARWRHNIKRLDMSLGYSTLDQGSQTSNQIDGSFGVQLEDTQLSSQFGFSDNDNYNISTVARLRLGEQLVQLRGEYGKSQGQTRQQIFGSWRKQFGLHSVNINASYQPRSNNHNFTAEVSSQFDYIRFGARLRHDPQQKFTLALTMSTAFAWDAPWSSLSRNSYNQAARVKVRTYKDNNDNQQFDSGDTPLSGVKFVTSQKLKSVKDTQGNHTLYGLPSYRPQYLEINTDQLDDPFVSPQKDKFQLTSHPGGEVHIDIPFYDIYEVEGDIQILQPDGNVKGKGVVPIYLVKNGQIIQEGKSEYDGYFLFDKVMPGQYHVVIAAHWLEKKGLVVREDVELKLNLDSNSDSMVTMEPIVLILTEQ